MAMVKIARPASPSILTPREVDLARVDELVEQALAPAQLKNRVMDRRTRNGLRTQQEILKAAWRLFLTVGYEQTTVQDITEAADIGKGTFFTHFSKKSDVALYLCTGRATIIQEMYEQGAFGEGSASARVEAMMVTFAELNCESDPEARSMTEIVLRQFFAEPMIMLPEAPAIEEALAGILADGVSGGEFPPDTDCEAGARLLHAAFYSAKAAWLRPGRDVVPFDLVEGVRADMRVILRGLSG